MIVLKKSKHKLVLYIVVCLVCLSCDNNNSKYYFENVQNTIPKELRENPIYDYTLDFNAPRFDKITVTDFEKAFEMGISIKKRMYQELIENEETPSFENTVLKIEQANFILERAKTIWDCLIGNGLTNFNATSQIDRISNKFSEDLYGYEGKLFANENLFVKLKKVYDYRNQLNESDKRLTEYYFAKARFHKGHLTKKKKKELVVVEKEIADIQKQIDSIKKTRSIGLLIEKKSELKGLSEQAIKLTRKLAQDANKENGFIVPYFNNGLNSRSILSQLEEESIRRKYYESKEKIIDDFYNSHPEIIKLIDTLAIKRLTYANILGLKNFASTKLQGFFNGYADSYLNSPQEIINFSSQVAQQSKDELRKENEAILAKIGKEDNVLRPWNLYAFKREYHGMMDNDSLFTPYFQLDNVVKNGLFYLSKKLFGLTFTLRKDIPVYHDDVQVYEVIDENKTSLGLVYLDLYAREGKSPMGFFHPLSEHSNYFKQKSLSLGGWNLQKDKPLTPLNVISLFHDFGHAIHNLLIDRKYAKFSSMFFTPEDFGEFPSQLYEFAAFHPDILKNYAHHETSKEIITDTLIDELVYHFNFGFSSYMYSSSLRNFMSTQWHSLENKDSLISSKIFESKILRNYSLSNRHESDYHFIDFWINPDFIKGWPSGYHFNYTQFLAADAFQFLLDNGGINRENGEQLRNLLRLGNSKNMKKAYLEYLGRSQDIRNFYHYKFPLYVTDENSN